MKLNKLFYLLVAVSAIFVACNNDNGTDTPALKGTLDVTEKAVDFKFFGGEGVINYTITNGSANALPTAVANKEWVNNITVGETIKFNVDLNNVEESRVASITVTYGEQTFEVFVRQDAGYEIDVEFTAGALNGECYGTSYSSIPNYFAILSKNGTTGNIDLYLDTYYRLDMFHTTPAGDPLTLPQGVYEYDPYGLGDKISFGGSYTLMFQTHEDGTYTEGYLKDGVVIVTENKVEAILVLTTGEVHHVVYEGSLELGWLQFETPDFYSTLENDYSFNHTGGTIRLVNYGDYFNVGGNNWGVSMVLPGSPINGDYFMLDIVTGDLGTTRDSIVGTYTCAAKGETVAKNTFGYGYMDGVEYMGSWYQVIVDNFVDHSQVAPLAGGTITIEAEGTGFLVTYDCMDDNGHKITGTFSCPIVEEYNPQ
ncbi:MAG: BACON domain-containing protein [Alistipes sp.]|nr:BACON domain-containing protein [Alistipes sp.]